MKDIMNNGFFDGKKVLVFGLGILGGGIATSNWLLKQGAQVTITDLKDEKQLVASLRQIKDSVQLHLGQHSEQDIYDHDVIVINPAISIHNPYVILAKELGKQIENEATLFYQFCRCPIIAVTGTRGKTTTTNWIGHFLKPRYKAIIAGNSPKHPLLNMLNQRCCGDSNFNKKGMPVVVNEIPSFHLELFTKTRQAPDIAVLTNLYPDHLNRYSSLLDYARTKANIFIHQGTHQHLILNYDNEWTPFFLSQNPSSKVWFFSHFELPANTSGVFFHSDAIYFQDYGKQACEVVKLSNFGREYGEHNLANLLASSLTAFLKGVRWEEIQQGIVNLPTIPFRQETIFENKKIKIINDTTATTPEGGLVAIKRFGARNCILITGGTDAELNYTQWAKELPQYIDMRNVVFLSGSATSKMLDSLSTIADKGKVANTLLECIKIGLERASHYTYSTFLFSPAAKSFEKFKNEMDRGRQFNKLIRREIRKWLNGKD